MKLANVLITGANRGLGLQFVKEFTLATVPPQHLIATCRQKSSALELLKLATEHSNIHIFELDVCDDSQYPRLIEEVQSVVGDAGVNLLVNNAGVYDKTISSIKKVTKDSLMAHFETNVVAPVLFTKAMLPLLQQAAIVAKQAGEQGTSAGVVNISSVMGCSHGIGSMPTGMPYRVSKAALNKATHCLSFELEPDDIIVTAVHPGWVRTDMGTMSAPIGPQESVQNIMENIVLKLGRQHSGKLFNFSGSELAF